jgi:hypothetical protein
MKKGIVPLWFSVFFAFLAVALLLVFYFVFLRGSRAPEQIAVQESISATSNNVLVNYLNTPVVVNGETITFADLVRLWYNDRPKYQAALMDETQKVLPKGLPTYSVGGVMTKMSYWVEIYEPNEFLKKSHYYIIALNKPAAISYNWELASAPVAVDEYKSVIVAMRCVES